MAEPMDIDIISEFDNKENSAQHNNLLPRTPCTEKGYEELDVSELNMKLRYSITPVSSPMSKSYTANCSDNKNQELDENVFNANLTRSFNSAIPRNELNKSLKPLPLQSMTAEQLLDNNRNTSVLRPLDTTTTFPTNTTITITDHNDINDNLSIPSTSSSNAHTPELTTPTKDIVQADGGSPIMRGLKTVLNMFRSSQSPIPPENDGNDAKHVLSPPDIPEAVNITPEVKYKQPETVLASTPITTHKKKEGSSSKRNSPLKESIVFNEDLEKELLWKEESTVLFSEEKIPIHKLLFQHPLPSFLSNTNTEVKSEDKKPESVNTTVEYMDISYNDTLTLNRTLTDIQTGNTFNAESDSEFLDCETTLNDDVKVQTPRKSECVTNDTLENKPQIIETDAVALVETILPQNTAILDEINQKHCDAADIISDTDIKTTSSETNIVPEENISIISSENNQNLSLREEFCTKEDSENVLSSNKQGRTLEQNNIENLKNDIATVMSFSEPCEGKVNFEISSTNVDESKIIPIEDEMKNEIVEIHNIPANIPLPEEDEIEINMDPSNNTANAEFVSTIPIDNVPIEITDQANLVENQQFEQNIDPESINAYIEKIQNTGGNSPNSTKQRSIADNINLVKNTDQNNLESLETLKVIPVDTDINRHDLTYITNEINDAEKVPNVPVMDYEASTCSDAILDKFIDVDSKPNEVQKIQVIGSIHKDNETFIPEKTEIGSELKLEHQLTDNILSLDVSSAQEHANQLNNTVSIEIPNSDPLGVNIDIASDILPDLISDTINDAPAQILIESTENKIVTEICDIDQIKLNLSIEPTIDSQIVKEIEINDNVKEEEIQLSDNNSPYVSISSEMNIISEKIISDSSETTTVTKEAISPPLSPKISSKGYNFNFDDIEDPFVTKTKIRLSPPLESLNKTFSPLKTFSNDTDKNKRKTQSERKKPIYVKKNVKSSSAITKIDEPVKNLVNDKFDKKPDFENIKVAESNPSFDTSNKTEIPTSIVISEDPALSSSISTPAISSTTEINDSASKDDNQHASMATREIINDHIANDEVHSTAEFLSQSIDVKNSSSSEHSTYYSAATSSGESFVNKNVFNIPEIDDLNFNPFTTKSKVCPSPSPDKEMTYIGNSSKEISKNMEDNEILVSDEKECADISNTTSSSKATDEKDVTVKEILTEDDDTMEGPFLETEDIEVDDKMCDVDNNDFMLSELPKQGSENNLDAGELFIDADAFEFLLNQNQHNAVADSAKESLFLKFDPLFAKRVSTDGVLSVLKNIQKRQSTPQKASGSHLLDTTFEKPIAGPSKVNNSQEEIMDTTNDESTDDLNVTVTKPTMVVTPAVNPIMPRTKSTPVANLNRRSITFTSPAIAVIDRLLSMSGNNSILGDTTVTQVNTEQNEADIALIQLREMLADKEIHVYNLRTETKELRERLSNLESQMRTLETESAQRLKKINDLNETLVKKIELNKSMATVVEEYERTIASLISEKEQDKKRNNEERRKLIQERDEQTAHLASMEISFSDLHNKYEKSKQIIFTYKANEDAYKKSIKEFEDNISKTLANYELLKQHATSKLNHANQELEKINRAHDAEVLKLNAMIKRKDVHITSLEETLTQKTKANEELAAICDELINKVG